MKQGLLIACALGFWFMPESHAQLASLQEMPVSSPKESNTATVVEETVIIQRTTTVKTPETAQPPEAPPPPPTPSVRDAAEPKRLVRYFCRAWKDENYERMYWAMDGSFHKRQTLAAFTERFEKDKEFNGGLADENIAAEEKDVGASKQLTVTLRFRSKRAKERVINAQLVKTPDGYRLIDSGILPVDVDNL